MLGVVTLQGSAWSYLMLCTLPAATAAPSNQLRVTEFERSPHRVSSQIVPAFATRCSISVSVQFERSPHRVAGQIPGGQAKKRGFPDFLVSRICRDSWSAGVTRHKKSTLSAQQIPVRAYLRTGFHAERPSNAFAGSPPHRHMADLKDIDNIKPQKIVSSLQW